MCTKMWTNLMISPFWVLPACRLCCLRVQRSNLPKCVEDVIFESRFVEVVLGNRVSLFASHSKPNVFFKPLRPVCQYCVRSALRGPCEPSDVGRSACLLHLLHLHPDMDSFVDDFLLGTARLSCCKCLAAVRAPNAMRKLSEVVTSAWSVAFFP